MKAFKLFVAMAISLVLVGCGESMEFKMTNGEVVKVSGSDHDLKIKIGRDTMEYNDASGNITGFTHTDIVFKGNDNPHNALAILEVLTDGRCNDYYVIVSIGSDTEIGYLKGMCEADSFAAGGNLFGLRIVGYKNNKVIYDDVLM